MGQHRNMCLRVDTDLSADSKFFSRVLACVSAVLCRQDETNKKDLKEMFAQMQFTSPNRPTTQQRKFSRSSSDSSAVLAKRNSVRYTIVQN